MPTYEYKCKECKHEFERLLKIAEINTPLEEACPDCQKENTVEKLFPSSAPSLGDPVALGIRKPGGKFKERLQQIKRDHPNGKINV